MKKCIFVFCLCLIAFNCYAMGETEAMSCKGGIVSPGATMLTVIGKCGQPANRLAVDGRYKYAGKVYRATEQWLYNFGPSEFQYIVVFNGNTVSLMYSTNDHGF